MLPVPFIYFVSTTFLNISKYHRGEEYTKLKSFANITAYCRFEKSSTGSHSAVGLYRGILVIRD